MTLFANDPGIDGFLGTRASLMLDVVFLAMFAVVPLMLVSVYLVKYRQMYVFHKRIQLLLAAVLTLAVTLFEIDVRVNEWRPRAAASPFYDERLGYGWMNWALWIHLVFAVSTTVLWIYVVVQALRKIPRPPGPSAYSAQHIFWARLATLDMTLTAITGCVFYYLAFVAS